MTNQQLEYFKIILNTWKNKLINEANLTINTMKDSTSLADPNDRASQAENFSLELLTKNREHNLLNKIEQALLQINNKNYGYCKTCNIEIEIKRLKARPTTTLCIDCKTIAEIRKRKY